MVVDWQSIIHAKSGTFNTKIQKLIVFELNGTLDDSLMIKTS